MKHFSQKDIDTLSKIYRLNLINSATGYKSAQLVGSVSSEGNENLAVFSSIVHLGSNPALIGMILRPTTVPRHTYANMKATGVFTLNAIHESQIEDAHHTSASYPESISEFDKTQLKVERKKNFLAPFVKDSPIQMACKYLNEYHIKENDTLLIVGSIEDLYVKDSILLEDGWIQLDLGGIVTINGLDGYAIPKLQERFPYARPKDE
ncbi:flavin reductase family protein [Flavobacteriaceae bacterium]|jgi:flavin reductase (DIM6/NTAB) family NADH-FMN oxidoreductase RutF|nr:flavin reductase [Flavobacteriaceae bacterium]MBT5091073.1 flavin reductase [Flavobacteriaceae bacterium]MBT5282660.1 flavin reductase [Flavobacteriaceae bacterium]MBT5446926.1 flavin reductase [Flavobacteriaceae bacterium]MBT5693448.1 flavin reductase [Flavobacteriaceae bacterium]|tara:strand:- start:568 stop:1188 length:621 start_codon:yes stop_codon:yes gene_type:complete